jgi:hypothetical protein
MKIQKGALYEIIVSALGHRCVKLDVQIRWDQRPHFGEAKPRVLLVATGSMLLPIRRTSVRKNPGCARCRPSIQCWKTDRGATLMGQNHHGNETLWLA